MTQGIAQMIPEVVDPVGVGVIREARHFRLMMRGVEKQHSGAVTRAMPGDFPNRKETRDEFLALVAKANRVQREPGCLHVLLSCRHEGAGDGPIYHPRHSA